MASIFCVRRGSVDARRSAPSISPRLLGICARGARWLRDLVAWWELRKFGGDYVAVQDTRRDELSSFLGSDARTRTIFNGVPPVDLRQIDTRFEAQCAPSSILQTINSSSWGWAGWSRKKDHLYFWRWQRSCTSSIRRPDLSGSETENCRANGRPRSPATACPTSVSCTGWKSDVRPYLAAADLLLHTAEYEGLPFAMIEAMSMGVPCAISRSVASELPFLNARNAIFYDDPGRLEHLVCSPAGSQERLGKPRAF